MQQPNNYPVDFKKINEERFLLMKRINLAALLCDKFNYHVIKKAGREIVVDGGTAGTLNIYPDRRDPDQWRFKNWYDGVGGDVIQYLSTYERFGDLKDKETLKSIYEFLKAYEPSAFSLDYIYSETKEKTLFRNPDLSSLPLEHNEYLHSRGIDLLVLNSPKYQGAVLNKLNLDEKRGISFLNTAIPIVSRNGNLVSFEMKNGPFTPGEQGFSGIVKYGYVNDGLWYSNKPAGELKNLIIGEAFIDCISYSVLHPERLTDSRDLSFIGRFSQLQMPHIQDHINNDKPEHVILISDNDTPGFGYDLALIGGLRPPSSSADPRINASLNVIKTPGGHSSNYVKMNFELKAGSSGLSKEQALSFISLLYAKLDSLKIAGQNAVSLQPVKFIDTFGVAKFEASFHINLGIEKKLLSIFNETFNASGFFIVDKVQGKSLTGAQFKDYNEKLMDAKGLKKQNVCNNLNPFAAKLQDANAQKKNLIQGRNMQVSNTGKNGKYYEGLEM